MAKKIDPKAKAKRQKIYAGVGGVILLAVLAFQLPRTLKMLHPASTSSSSSAPAPTTPSASPVPIAAPTLSGGNASASTASAAPGGDGISDPDAVPAPESGQLLAFGLFRSKDPFAQQLRVGPTGSSGAAAAPGATGASVATGASGPTSGSASSTTAAKSHSTPVVSSRFKAAKISVNGLVERVQLDGS